MMRKIVVNKWNELLYYPNIYVLVYTKCLDYIVSNMFCLLLIITGIIIIYKVISSLK